jgi:DNA polymerase V
MSVTDKLNTKYGRNTLKLGALGTKQTWQIKAEMRTPGYTTVWAELLMV